VDLRETPYVSDPADYDRTEEDERMEDQEGRNGFRVVASKGFQLTFDNGWIVSVMFGRGNYCSDRWEGPQVGEVADHSDSLAEVAIFRADGDIGDVQGWRTADEVADIISEVKGRP
jgi:hypothetical protein